jgi:hypothetical protein
VTTKAKVTNTINQMSLNAFQSREETKGIKTPESRDSSSGQDFVVLRPKVMIPRAPVYLAIVSKRHKAEGHFF